MDQDGTFLLGQDGTFLLGDVPSGVSWLRYAGTDGSRVGRVRRQARRTWAQLIRRVYEVDPLICQECGGEMRILAFLFDPVAIRKIVTHLAPQAGLATRGPPAASPRRVRAAS